MAVKFLPCLMLLWCLIFGASSLAWAAICATGETPVCEDVDGLKGKLNETTGNCVYSPVCESDGSVPINGVCPGDLECPSGTTGTSPDNCIVGDPVCPDGSTEEPNGTCKTSGRIQGERICPPPSKLDTATGKCLFPVGKATIDALCPDGFYKADGRCRKDQPCPNGAWNEKCVMQPDPAAVCDYVDQNTPLQ